MVYVQEILDIINPAPFTEMNKEKVLGEPPRPYHLRGGQGMRICIILPAYNEAGSIGNVIEEIKKNVSLKDTEIVVIDDGSSDKTALVAKARGATIIKNQRNEGKGASLIKGFKYALNNGFDGVITMDADGQHAPSEIQNFIKLPLSSKSGIFIGNRMNKRRNMPLVRVWTNKIMSWLISKVSQQKIPDTQCGFRFIRKEVLKKINFATSKYETESELLIKAARLGFTIESVLIKSIYTRGSSSINPIVDTFRFIRFILREIWNTKH